MRLAFYALLGLAQAVAQPAGMDAKGGGTTQPVPVVAPCCVPAGTPLEIEITEAISSRDRKRGDTFAFRVTTPLQQGDTVLVPAGTGGIGEIVHADRARGGGKPGEIVLAARYLLIDDAQVPVRGLKLGAAGEDRTGSSLAASFALGPFALFIHGGEILIPAGTIARVKLARDLAIPSPTPQDIPTRPAEE